MKKFAYLIPLMFACALSANEEEANKKECCLPTYPFVGEFFLDYDHFRGPAEGTWNGNAGAVIGANVGVLIWNSIGAQIGASYGVYDWNGRGPLGGRDSDSVQQQGFVTSGAFYKTRCCDGFMGGIVVDYMFNKNFGVFGLNPNIGQVRWQAGYLKCCKHEFGVWGATNINTTHKCAFEIPVSFRAISQVSLYYKHIFDNCAEAMVWAGIPYRKSLLLSGKRSGNVLVGASFRAPLTSCLSFEGHGVYMAPVNNRYSHKFHNDGVNVSIGLTYAFGVGCNECCELWHAKPYFPVANNSNFLVDTSLSN